MTRKLFVEFLGTFVLSLAVLLSVSLPGIIPTPFVAGLVLLLFVYTIGGISGCHINPGVTLGLLSLKKISPIHAGQYIIVQLLGAVTAFLLMDILGMGHAAVMPVQFPLYFFEGLGMAIFTFGIGAVVFDRDKASVSGIVIGGSLLLGILISAMAGAAGILNPAVAVALKTTAVGYYIAQIIGGIIGLQVYAYIAGHHSDKR